MLTPVNVKHRHIHSILDFIVNRNWPSNQSKPLLNVLNGDSTCGTGQKLGINSNTCRCGSEGICD